jgi:hypothetical protein
MVIHIKFETKKKAGSNQLSAFSVFPYLFYKYSIPPCANVLKKVPTAELLA